MKTCNIGVFLDNTMLYYPKVAISSLKPCCEWMAEKLIGDMERWTIKEYDSRSCVGLYDSDQNENRVNNCPKCGGKIKFSSSSSANGEYGMVFKTDKKLKCIVDKNKHLILFSSCCEPFAMRLKHEDIEYDNANMKIGYDDINYCFSCGAKIIRKSKNEGKNNKKGKACKG